MNWRTAGFVMGALGLLCCGTLLSVAYPFSTSEPHGALWEGPFSVGPDERFSVEDGTEYSVTATHVRDGETVFITESVVTDDWRYVSRSLGDTTVSVYYAPDGTAYERVEYEDDELADQQAERIESDDERELLGEERNGDGVTIFAVDEGDSDVAHIVSDEARLSLGALALTTYERVEEREETNVYEPRDGWFDEGKAYRITDSSGEVRVDADSYAVESADVSYTVTEEVETYAEYVVDTLTEAEQYTIELTYEFEEGDAEIDVPQWVEEAHDER